MSGESDSSHHSSPDDLKAWLDQEIRDLSKAFELRVRDATDIVTSYALGRIDPEEAQDRMRRYLNRWGDSPVPGAATTDGMTNDEILDQVDRHSAAERLTRRDHGARSR